jgi:hypothetical protein
MSKRVFYDLSYATTMSNTIKKMTFYWIIFHLGCNVKICVFVFVIQGAMEQWKFAVLNPNHKM